MAAFKSNFIEIANLLPGGLVCLCSHVEASETVLQPVKSSLQ